MELVIITSLGMVLIIIHDLLPGDMECITALMVVGDFQ